MIALLTRLSKLMKTFFGLIIWGVENPAIWLVERIKRLTGCKTYHVESGFVLLVLALVVVLTGHTLTWSKWIEMFAVFFTFSHASVAQRLEEKQQQQLETHGEAEVECFRMLEAYFIGKEFLWMIAFIEMEAWPALTGVIIFLMFYPWREAWRRRHPLQAATA